VIQVKADAINADGHVETPENDADFALVITTGGQNNSQLKNPGLIFKYNNRERLRINEHGDFLVAGNHRTSVYEGLKFTYSASPKASVQSVNGHLTTNTVSSPDKPITVNPLPTTTGITFRNSTNGNAFQIGNDGLLRASSSDVYIVPHAF
jgi:hypothetical protein